MRLNEYKTHARVAVPPQTRIEEIERLALKSSGRAVAIEDDHNMEYLLQRPSKTDEPHTDRLSDSATREYLVLNISR